MDRPEKENLIEQLKKLNREQLLVYGKTTNKINYIISFSGVCLFLFMIYFPQWIVIIPSLILVYFLANMSVGLVDLNRTISELLETFKDK